MVTIPLERLEAGVEYTFNLIVWKAGRKEEATNQTVGCARIPQFSPTPGQYWCSNLVSVSHSYSIPRDCEFSLT